MYLPPDINPNDDGIRHVNVYSRGRSELGRFLSNFAHTPFDSADGHFESIEGYWHWLGISPHCPQRDQLRRLWGLKARNCGRQLRRNAPAKPLPDFEDRIRMAVRAKLEANRWVLKDRCFSLPLKHYYLAGDKGFVEPKEFQWLLRVLREELDRLAQSRKK